MSTSAPQVNLNAAIQYGLLVKLAEAVPPDQTVYKPGDVINITYDTINLNYTVLTTFYGNDLATDANPERATQIVSFGFVAQDPAGNVAERCSSGRELQHLILNRTQALSHSPHLGTNQVPARRS
jgi:hypothetical protein